MTTETVPLPVTSAAADVAATPLRLALPKGRLQEGVLALLDDAGVRVDLGGRAYRPTVSLPDTEAKLLKPQNVVEMLAVGARDLGFAGADWALEKDAPLVELLDTGLNPVRIVAAAPRALLEAGGALPARVRGAPSSSPPSTWAWPRPGSNAPASTPASCAPTARPRCSRRRTPT